MAWAAELYWDGRQESWDDVDVEMTEELDLSGGQVAPREVTLELLFGWDVDAWMADGHRASRAVLTVTRNGVRVMRGPVRDLEAGRDGEPTRLTASEDPGLSSLRFPTTVDRFVTVTDQEAMDERQTVIDARNAELVAEMGEEAARPFFVDENQLPNLTTQVARGLVYQQVWGQPAGGSVAGSSAYVIDTAAETALIAGHGLTNGTLTVDDGSTTAVLTTTTTTDEQGRQITVVDLDNAGTGLVVDGDKEYKVTWSGTATGREGGAGDVLAYWLGLVREVRIDYAQVASFRGRLNQITLGFVIEEEVEPWRWIQDALLPLLPVSLVPGPKGLRVVWTAWDGDPNSVSTHLVEGELSCPLSRPMSGDDERVTFLTVDTEFDIGNARANQGIVVGPTTHFTAAEGERLGGRAEQRLRTALVADAASAYILGGLKVQTMARSRDRQEWDLSPEVYGLGQLRELRLGDQVLATSTTYAWSSEPCMVVGLRRDRERLIATLARWGRAA